MIIYDELEGICWYAALMVMIFIHCDWVVTGWHWSIVSCHHCISLKGLFKICENISPLVGLKPKEQMRCVIICRPQCSVEPIM
jgi:hypothetical protein